MEHGGTLLQSQLFKGLRWRITSAQRVEAVVSQDHTTALHPGQLEWDLVNQLIIIPESLGNFNCDPNTDKNWFQAGSQESPFI